MDSKYYKYIQTFFVVTPMSLILALVALYRNYGFETGWVSVFFNAWIVMYPVAYACAFIIIPFSKKVTEKIVR